MTVDIAIIGAGMAGLVCAQQLQQAGYQVILVDKSRGIGGRMATRRLHDTLADHGTCYLKPQSGLLLRLIEQLGDQQILKVWTEQVYSFDNGELIANPPAPRYIAPEGMNVVAKFLAQNLEIKRNLRAIQLSPTPEKIWKISFAETEETLSAKAVIIAIPSPQALDLVSSLKDNLEPEFLSALESVEFYPSLSLMAGYESFTPPDWKAVTFPDDPILGWVGFDSSKRVEQSRRVFVLQSSAKFAETHLETTDLNPVAQAMFHQAGKTLLAALAFPEWFQIHRWRYAFPKQPLAQTFLDANLEIPLLCCGDWCGGELVAGAMESGMAAAQAMNTKLEQKMLPGDEFLGVL